MNASKQKTLSELLDQIDLRYKRSLADPYDPATCENSLRDIPALVKALRKAVEMIETCDDGCSLVLDPVAQLLREPADSVQSEEEVR